MKIFLFKFEAPDLKGSKRPRKSLKKMFTVNIPCSGSSRPIRLSSDENTFCAKKKKKNNDFIRLYSTIPFLPYASWKSLELSSQAYKEEME